MAQIILVEDEQLIAEELELILRDFGHEVIAIVNNSKDLFQKLSEVTPDLIFLDIELHQALDGVDVAAELNHTYKIPFLFVSSKMDDKVIERAKYTRPLGFISKPFTKQQLKTQLTLALHSLDARMVNTEKQELFVKENGSLVKVKFNDILYISAMDNYSVIQLNQRRVIYSSTLKELCSRIEKSTDNFHRIHRSYYVNIAKIQRVENKVVVLFNEEKIPLSDSKKQGLLSKLNLL